MEEEKKIVKVGKNYGGKGTTTTAYLKSLYYSNNSEIPELPYLVYSDITPSLSKFSVADICIICDITGSMQNYLDAVRNMLNDFMNASAVIMGLNPRFSFIGYRDKKDNEQIVKKDFTTNVEEIKELLAKTECDGGGDTCEDLVKPLTEALSLDWKSDQLFVFHIIDAPSHGNSYHLGSSDDFPTDDESKMLEKLMCHYRDRRINYKVIRCNNTVNKMLNIMSKYYGSETSQLEIIDLKAGKEEGLVKSLSEELCDKLAESVKNTIRKNFRKITRSHLVDIVEAKSEAEIEFSGDVYGTAFGKKQPKYELMDYTYDFALAKTVVAKKYKINPIKIGEGAFSTCYFLCSMENPEEKYVTKISLTPAVKLEDLRAEMEVNLFATFFCNRLNQVKGTKYAKAIPLAIIELSEESQKHPIFNKSKFILIQRYLKGKYIKYNNNYGWWLRTEADNKINQIAQAFSHFSYEASIGSLLFVDIQGVLEAEEKKEILVITDPAIHSALYKGRFGETNWGKMGIFRFFATHECNEICKSLKLTDPRTIEKDKVSKVVAKYSSNLKIKHLIGNMEMFYDDWLKGIRSFNPDRELNCLIAKAKEIDPLPVDITSLFEDLMTLELLLAMKKGYDK